MCQNILYFEACMEVALLPNMLGIVIVAAHGLGLLNRFTEAEYTGSFAQIHSNQSSSSFNSIAKVMVALYYSDHFQKMEFDSTQKDPFEVVVVPIEN